VRIQSGLLPEPPLPSMETLPDYLRTGLDVVSIGLNPSLPSVRAGYYFANPRNRFWRALHGSRLVPSAAVMGPGIAAMETLLQHGIGFTDVVKRPTAGGHELRAADFRAGAPLLQQKLLFCAPRIAWFHGKQAYAGYLRYAEGITTDIEWGEQPLRVGDSRVFVTPNPSPANAVFSLADLIAWYVRLGEFRGRTGAGAE
jgi:TDG/mug DNA glycosylase family protein